MDFGKLSSVDSVRFDLPPEDFRIASILSQNKRSSFLRVYVGGPVWSCPKWNGTVYPRGTLARDFLREYSKQFNSIELNTTFYRIPNPEQIQIWKKIVPSDFKFAPKLHQDISHCDNFTAAKESLKLFWKNIQYFEENLGLCFLQLPPFLGYSAWGTLRNLLREVPNLKQLAIEFRHPSWFHQRTIRPDVVDFLQTQGVSMVMTDVAGRRDVLHSSLTSRKLMIRFTGNELHLSDFSRIDAWVERIASWIDRGIEEVYFFIHQPDEAGVPELSKKFIELLNERCHLSLRPWNPLEEPKNLQMNLF